MDRCANNFHLLQLKLPTTMLKGCMAKQTTAERAKGRKRGLHVHVYITSSPHKTWQKLLLYATLHGVLFVSFSSPTLSLCSYPCALVSGGSNNMNCSHTHCGAVVNTGMQTMVTEQTEWNCHHLIDSHCIYMYVPLILAGMYIVLPLAMHSTCTKCKCTMYITHMYMYIRLHVCIHQWPLTFTIPTPWRYSF